jgi:ankyrin repeat protein
MKNFSRVTNGIFMCLSMIIFSSFVSAMDWEEETPHINEKATKKLSNIVNNFEIGHAAAPEFNEKIVEINEALEDGADVNVRNADNFTLLHFLLLREERKYRDNPKGKTAFFKSTIKPILNRYRPNLMIQCKLSGTPLHLAVDTGDKETIKDIVTREPRAKFIRDGLGRFIGDGLGRTPLDLAKRYKLSEDIQDLLR